MSRPTDPLRDKIEAYLSEVERDKLDALDGPAEDIAAIVRAFATSDAAVEAAAEALYVDTARTAAFDAIPWMVLGVRQRERWIKRARAAITAALGGEP